MKDTAIDSDNDMFMKVVSEQFCEWKGSTPCCDANSFSNNGDTCSSFYSKGYCVDNYPINEY